MISCVQLYDAMNDIGEEPPPPQELPVFVSDTEKAATAPTPPLVQEISRFHGCVKRLLLSGVHCALAGEEGLDGAVEAPRCLYGRSQETALRGVHAANTTHLRRVVSKNRNMFGLLSCAGCNRLTRIACAGGEGVAHGPAMGAQHPDGPRRCGDRSPCPRLWCGRERGYPLPNRPGPRRGLFFLYSR